MTDAAFTTDVLVYASLPRSSQHAACRAALSDQLAAGKLYLTAAVCAEWIATVTDPKQFNPPAPVPAAVANVKLFLAKANVKVLPSGEPVVTCMIGLMERYPTLAPRDSLVLASVRMAGVRTLVTTRVEDFPSLDFVDVIDPAKVR